MKLNVKQIEALENWWEEATEEEKHGVMIDINSYNGYFVDEIWVHIDYFDDYHCDSKPWDIARAVYFGNFNPVHSYWRYDAYGNLESTDYLNIDVEIGEIISNLAQMPEQYMPGVIENLFKEIEEQE